MHKTEEGEWEWSDEEDDPENKVLHFILQDLSFNVSVFLKIHLKKFSNINDFSIIN